MPVNPAEHDLDVGVLEHGVEQAGKFAVCCAKTRAQVLT
jgi:hypothetical protein